MVKKEKIGRVCRLVAIYRDMFWSDGITRKC